MVDPNDERLRYARKLKTAGLVVRIIGAAVMVGSILGVLVALNLRRSDDRIGFSLISLAVLLFGALVWGSGMFHSAVARFLPSILDVEAKLDALARPKKARAARAAAAQPAGSESVVAAPVTDGPPPGASSPPDTGSSAPGAYPTEDASASQANAFLSGPTSTIPEPWTAEAASRVQAIAIATKTEQAAEKDDVAKDARTGGDHSLLAESGAASESTSAKSAASEVRISDAASRIVSDAEPERVPCPHCTGRIHPEASRCVHCMRRVEPHAALPS